MRRQPHFMRLKKRDERNKDPRYRFGFEFNDDHYAIATPEFWNAWRAGKDHTLRSQYFPAKYPAKQVGLQGEKPVWVVFPSRYAKEAFDNKLSSQTETLTVELDSRGRLKGLGWQSLTEQTGMFLDERLKTYSSERCPVVAWLNCNACHYSVNVVSDTFQLTRPIPRSITELGKAVQWVYQYSQWRH